MGEPTDVRGTSNASPSEWAGSVESTTVRRPASAQRRAVAAAVVVFPTPPLPVKSRIRVTGGSWLQVAAQLAEGGVDHLVLRAALHEARERDDEVDGEVVGDERAIGGAGD